MGGSFHDHVKAKNVFHDHVKQQKRISRPRQLNLKFSRTEKKSNFTIALGKKMSFMFHEIKSMGTLIFHH